MNTNTNQQPPQNGYRMVKPRVLREIPPEWDEIMRLAGQIPYGEIVIKIQDGKVHCTDYTVKRKPSDTEPFEVIPL